MKISKSQNRDHYSVYAVSSLLIGLQKNAHFWAIDFLTISNKIQSLHTKIWTLSSLILSGDFASHYFFWISIFGRKKFFVCLIFVWILWYILFKLIWLERERERNSAKNRPALLQRDQKWTNLEIRNLKSAISPFWGQKYIF